VITRSRARLGSWSGRPPKICQKITRLLNRNRAGDHSVTSFQLQLNVIANYHMRSEGVRVCGSEDHLMWVRIVDSLVAGWYLCEMLHGHYES